MANFKNFSIIENRLSEIPHDSEELMPEQKAITPEKLYDTVKAVPELAAVINALVTDVWGDGFNIYDSKTDEVDERFMSYMDKIDFLEKGMSFTFDGFLTGDGYLEKTFLDIETVKGLVELSSDDYIVKGVDNSSEFVTKALVQRFERVKNPFNVFHIKASTMEVVAGRKGIPSKYVQKIGSIAPMKTNLSGALVSNSSYETIDLMPDDVLRFTPWGIGEIYGFTPATALLNDMGMLIFAKRYASVFFENDGRPNSLFILKNGRGMKDSNYETIKAAINRMKDVNNRHKNLVISGDVQYEKLNDFNKDLEFERLITLVRETIALAFGVPPSRVPYGGKSEGDLKEMSPGYWKTISLKQKQLENLFNNELFNPMGKYIKFNRGYMLDEIREAQIIGILRDRDLITVKEARNKINYSGEVPQELVEAEKLKKLDLINQGTDDQIPFRDQGDKQDNGRGTGEDGGSKIAKGGSDVELIKGIGGAIHLSFDIFKRLVGRIVDFDEAKLFYKDLGEVLEVYFHDGNSMYRTSVVKNDPEFDNIFFTLRRAVKIA